MNTQEFVEQHVENFKPKFKRFFFTQLAADFVEIIIFVYTLLKFIDNQKAIYICIAVFIVVLELTFFINVKRNFGSLKKFFKESNISGRYKALLEEYKTTDNKAIFDQAISELETAIKNN